MNKIWPVILLCLAQSTAASAQSGVAGSQDSMFLPSGKSAAMQALEAKKNSRCVALYGPGYGALGDSDTCIKIGGRVSVTVGRSFKQNRLIVPSPGIGVPAPALGAPVVGVARRPNTGSATTADVYVDTHTQTDFGDLGTHIRVGGVRASGYLRGPDYIH
ncbi:MAG: hypothetical protein ACHQAY_10260 [Hyphomicrobiales bacterium]